MLPQTKVIGPKESEVQRVICEYLEAQGYFFWRSNNIPVFGKNNAGVKTFRSLPKYTPKGIADILCLEDGKFIAIEVKREGGVTTKDRKADQELFGKRVRDNGGRYCVVHSLEELKDLGF